MEYLNLDLKVQPFDSYSYWVSFLLNTNTLVDGVFGEWTDWSECSAKCDGGLHSRSRECNDPAPANGGADCQGAAAETQLCNEQACPGEVYIINLLPLKLPLNIIDITLQFVCSSYIIKSKTYRKHILDVFK